MTPYSSPSDQPYPGSGSAVHGARPPDGGCRARLRCLVQQSADFIAMAAADGTVDYLNEAGRRLIGLADTDALYSRPLASLVLLADDRRWTDASNGRCSPASWAGPPGVAISACAGMMPRDVSPEPPYWRPARCSRCATGRDGSVASAWWRATSHRRGRQRCGRRPGSSSVTACANSTICRDGTHGGRDHGPHSGCQPGRLRHHRCGSRDDHHRARLDAAGDLQPCRHAALSRIRLIHRGPQARRNGGVRRCRDRSPHRRRRPGEDRGRGRWSTCRSSSRVTSWRCST